MIVQALVPKNFDLKKKIFFTTPQKSENAMGQFFFISETHFGTSLSVSHAPSSALFPPKWSKIEVLTNKNILNVIMTQFGIIGLILVPVAHCFENFYKITKNNILPTNLKNLKNFQISKLNSLTFF